MTKYKERSHNCVQNLIRTQCLVCNQNNFDTFGFSLRNLNTVLGKVYSGFCGRPVSSLSPHFGALLNYF